MKHLLIVGVGGFPREIYATRKGYIGYGTDWDIKGYLDGDKKASPEEYEKMQMPLLGDIYSYTIEQGDVFYCAIGAPDVRKRIVAVLAGRGAEFSSLIHSSAIIGERVVLGQGLYVGGGTSITDYVKVGEHVSILGKVTIGHDCTIGDYASIMSHAAIMGWAQIGDASYIGTGAIILPRARVGQNAYVGAGSVVLRKVKDGIKVFGVPATQISSDNDC